MRDDEYEWDDDKAARNLADHGISFEAARRAFDDTYGITLDDDSEPYDEDRYILIGFCGDVLLHVSYTIRGHRTRIISARGAEAHERRFYHEESSRR